MDQLEGSTGEKRCCRNKAQGEEESRKIAFLENEGMSRLLDFFFLLITDSGDNL